MHCFLNENTTLLTRLFDRLSIGNRSPVLSAFEAVIKFVASDWRAACGKNGLEYIRSLRKEILPVSFGGLSFTVIESIVQFVVSGAGGLPGVSASERFVEKSPLNVQFVSMCIDLVMQHSTNEGNTY